MTFTIEKDVPVPDAPRGGRPRKYPFGDLKIGDSFFVPGAKGNQLGASIHRARNDASGKTFKVRTVDGGIRVWRTA